MQTFNFDELPVAVKLNAKELYVLKSDVITGVDVEQFGNSLLQSLHQALISAFQASSRVHTRL